MIATGTRPGVYELRAPLGAGGMGEVYRWQDLQRRFEQEARTVAALSYPNIVAVHGQRAHRWRDPPSP